MACWVSDLAIAPATCRLGRVQRNPTNFGVASTQLTNGEVDQTETNDNFHLGSRELSAQADEFLDLNPAGYSLMVLLRFGMVSGFPLTM